jgi:hypothetical protein
MPLPGTGIILENPAAAPIPTAVAWSLTNNGLSSFAGTSPFYQQPPYGTAVDVPDCYFNIPNVQTIANGTSYVIPPGMGYVSVPNTASTTFQFQLQVGALATWVTMGPGTAATAATYFYISDGTNVRINNAGAAGGNVTFYPVRA